MCCNGADVKDFGAAGDGQTDDTTAIQTAINSGAKEICFPAGEYLHGDLALDTPYQSLIGFGARLRRLSATATIAVVARGVTLWGLKFSGGGLAGNNITVLAPECGFFSCGSIETFGRALLAQDDGGNLTILGGIWNTMDHTASGYEIELKDTVTATSLYSKIIGVSTQQSFGGLLIDGQGTVKVSECQFGKLTILAGGGAFTSNRIIGTVRVEAALSQFENNAFASNVTFGTASGDAIGNIAFGPTNLMQAGNTLTIHSGVVESAFYLNQLPNTTFAINAPHNDIWHGRIPYTPSLGAAGGSPSLGNGILTGGYSRAGREMTIDILFQAGSTTNFGLSEFHISSPLKSGRDSVGSAVVTEDGTRNYAAVATVLGGDNKVRFLPADSAGLQNVGAIYPFAWGSGDFIRAQITIECAP